MNAILYMLQYPNYDFLLIVAKWGVNLRLIARDFLYNGTSIDLITLDT